METPVWFALYSNSIRERVQSFVTEDVKVNVLNDTLRFKISTGYNSFYTYFLSDVSMHVRNGDSAEEIADKIVRLYKREIIRKYFKKDPFTKNRFDVKIK